MEVKGTAMAGTLESSDAQVTVEPGSWNRTVHRKQRNQPVW